MVQHTDHDKNFIELMSDQKFAKYFYQTYLPAECAQKINWSSFKSEKIERFILNKSKSGKSHSLIADVAHSVDINGNKTLLWCHAEHQSSPDPLMLLRMLQYKISMLIQFSEHNRKKLRAGQLPSIISLIYYQGKKSWPYAKELKNLFALKDLGEKYFTKSVFIDLGGYNSEDLLAHKYIGVIEEIIKKVRQRKFSEKDFNLFGKLSIIDTQTRLTVLRYIVNQSDISKDALEQAILDNFSDGEEEQMTVADQYREEGRIAGLEQGMQQGMSKGEQNSQLRIAKNLLAMEIPFTDVSKATGLSVSMLKRI